MDLSEISHIGQFLEKEFLKPLNLTQSELAKSIQVPRARISDIVTGKRGITVDTDLRLCKYLGLSEGYFSRIQSNLELQQVKRQLKAELKKIQPREDAFNRTILFPGEDQATYHKKLSIGLICGGPSLERPISLNSARCIVDHLSSKKNVEIFPIYVDCSKNFYLISKEQLYSNTPFDFDFKLADVEKLEEKELIQKLKHFDIVFPTIHGKFGEDGELQDFLEKSHIPFIGSNSQTCKNMFYKDHAAKILIEHGYHVLPTVVLNAFDPDNEDIVRSFFEAHKLNKVVIKPEAGGSSVGVFFASTQEEAIIKIQQFFDLKIANHVLLEPFCSGREFSIVVLQNPDGSPVALVPSEIQVNYDTTGDDLFDYRRQYLPRGNTKWPCPPYFSNGVIEEIREKAEKLFGLFGMRDFTCMDGWVSNDGQIIFSDFNPITGMEPNSLIFEQSSRIGLKHQDVLWIIICNACHREGIEIIEAFGHKELEKHPVRVLLGGQTAERQVSLMSGANIWMKLLQSEIYSPEPYLLDSRGDIWHLPYTYAISHTFEEIQDNCLTSHAATDRLEAYVKDIHSRLTLITNDYQANKNLPKKYTFDTFLKEAKEENAFIFLGLHGGEGENGIVQQKLDAMGLLYNGSGPTVSELCMNKYLTGQAVSSIGDPKIITAPKKQIRISQFNSFTDEDFYKFWTKLQGELQSETFIIKPQNEGSSVGVVHLYHFEDLKKYTFLANNFVPYIQPGTFKNQLIEIDMPQDPNTPYIIEAFIEKDPIYIKGNEVIYRPETGWLELTVGVLESQGHYHAFNPTMRIVDGDVLSLEEKFQGSKGVNLTPPPEHIISKKSLQKIKSSIEKVAKALNIENYARLDLFFNVKTDTVLIIEANSLPGLTAAAVIYHQALAEEVPMLPLQFLERIIQLKEETLH